MSLFYDRIGCRGGLFKTRQEAMPVDAPPPPPPPLRTLQSMDLSCRDSKIITASLSQIICIYASTLLCLSTTSKTFLPGTKTVCVSRSRLLCILSASRLFLMTCWSKPCPLPVWLNERISVTVTCFVAHHLAQGPRALWALYQPLRNKTASCHSNALIALNCPMPSATSKPVTQPLQATPRSATLARNFNAVHQHHDSC